MICFSITCNEDNKNDSIGRHVADLHTETSSGDILDSTYSSRSNEPPDIDDDFPPRGEGRWRGDNF